VLDRVLATNMDQKKEGAFCQVLNRYSTMGRVTKFKKYNNFYRYGERIEQERVVNLQNKSLKKIISKERDKEYSYGNLLPLPINKISRIVGVFRGNFKKMRYTPNYSPDYLIRRVLESTFPEFAIYMQGKIHEVLPGSWKYASINLVDMCTPHERKYSVDEIIEGYKTRKDIDLKLPKIPKYNVDTILGLRVNGKAYPGVMTSRLFGSKRSISTPFTKGGAHQFAKLIMESKDYTVDKSLTYVGGREKRNKTTVSEDFKKIKIRITLGQEDIPTMIGQSLAKTINESLQMVNDGFNWGGRFNGRSNFLTFLDRLNINKSPGLINFSTDFSGHDNGVSEEQIVVAFSLIRSCFQEDPKLDKLFYYVMSGMIFKRIVLPESKLIYEISKGIATGHSFTSLITTLCAYGTISTAMSKIIPPEHLCNTHLQGAGDDWNGVCHKDYLNAVSDEINLNSGSKCDNFGDLKGNIVDDKTEGKPTFLKKTYMYGLLGWNDFELFTNLIYPTSTKMRLMTVIDNFMVMATSAPYNYRINQVIPKLITAKIYEKYCTKHILHNRFAYITNKYQKIFDRTINLLCTSSLSTEYLRKLDNVEHVNWTASGINYLEKTDTHEVIQHHLIELDLKLRKSMRWMLTNRGFTAYETLQRLKVFDLNKTYYKAHVYNIYDSPLISCIYLHTIP
jgi:hypothetical protein